MSSTLENCHSEDESYLVAHATNYGTKGDYFVCD